MRKACLVGDPSAFFSSPTMPTFLGLRWSLYSPESLTAFFTAERLNVYKAQDCVNCRKFPRRPNRVAVASGTNRRPFINYLHCFTTFLGADVVGGLCSLDALFSGRPFDLAEARIIDLDYKTDGPIRPLAELITSVALIVSPGVG